MARRKRNNYNEGNDGTRKVSANANCTFLLLPDVK